MCLSVDDTESGVYASAVSGAQTRMIRRMWSDIFGIFVIESINSEYVSKIGSLTVCVMRIGRKEKGCLYGQPFMKSGFIWGQRREGDIPQDTL